MNIHLHPYLFICLFFLIQNCPAQTQQARFNLVSGSNGILFRKDQWNYPGPSGSDVVFRIRTINASYAMMVR